MAHIGERVARALAYAHRLDVVHRDIAPSNVMVGFDGGVSLIDFGIARRPTDASLTATGDFVGRVAYSAPEVLAGGDVPMRAAISIRLAFFLWELLVGRPPAFEELKERPVPSSLAPEAAITSDLDLLVVGALEPDPARRFLGAEDLAAALLQVLPSAVDRKEELARLIARCYDIPLERQRLEAAIAEARPLLGRTNVEVVGQGRRRPRSGCDRRALAAAAVFVAGAGVAGLLAVRSEKSPATVAVGPVETQVAPPAAPPGPLSPAPTAAPWPATPAPALHLSARPGSSAKRFSTAARAPAQTKRVAAAPSPQAGLLLDRARDSLAEGAFDQAARSAKEVLEIGADRQKSAAHFILGKVLLFQGQRKEAAGEFSLAIELDAGNNAASDQLAALRRRGAE